MITNAITLAKPLIIKRLALSNPTTAVVVVACMAINGIVRIAK